MARQLKLLIVEDEEPIALGLREEFEAQGFAVDFSWNGKEGLKKALRNDYDLLLLDVMLPGVDGYQICKEVKKQRPRQAIIMLSARDKTSDVIEGLHGGADDYVPKPFVISELLARVQALLRRMQLLRDTQAEIHFENGFVIDTLNLCGNREQDTQAAVTFSKREMEIIEYLRANSHRPVSREELLKEVWGYKSVERIETRTVDIHIAKIRRKIEDDSQNPELLQTVWGQGYRLTGATS